MPASNPLDILIDHDQWATRQMLAACEALPPDQFPRRFEMGPCSLQATLTHILGAMRRWTDTLAGRPLRPRIELNGIHYSPKELLAVLDEAGPEFAQIARAYPLNQTVIFVRDGKEHTFTRGAVITHVTTHGMHHRAQCLNMLRQLGVTPLPFSSVTEWTRLADHS